MRHQAIVLFRPMLTLVTVILAGRSGWHTPSDESVGSLGAGIA